jgi:hypothetical protein
MDDRSRPITGIPVRRIYFLVPQQLEVARSLLAITYWLEASTEDLGLQQLLLQVPVEQQALQLSPQQDLQSLAHLGHLQQGASPA